MCNALNPSKCSGIDAQRCQHTRSLSSECRGIYAQRCKHTMSCMMAIMPRGVVKVSPVKVRDYSESIVVSYLKVEWSFDDSPF